MHDLSTKLSTETKSYPQLLAAWIFAKKSAKFHNIYYIIEPRKKKYAAKKLQGFTRENEGERFSFESKEKQKTCVRGSKKKVADTKFPS